MAHVCNEPLAAIGQRVHHAFQLPKALMNLLKQDPSYMAWENESQRFELWATNLGLYHQGHSSLDYRFRDAASLYSFAYKLLQDLEKCIAIVRGTLDDELQPAKSSQRQDMTTNAQINDIRGDSSALAPTNSFEKDDEDSEEDESFDSYQVQSLTEIAIQNMGDIVDRLYRLAFKIRSPATRLGFSKAEKYRDVDGDTNVDLIDTYATFDKNHVEEVFRHHRRTELKEVVDDFLILRLAKANTRRRQQFGQWRRHKINLEKVKQQASVLDSLDQVNSKRVHIGPSMDVAPMRDQLNPSQPSTATRVDHNKISLDDNASAISTSTYAIFSQEAERNLSIPRLPTNLKKKKEFECPYCHVLCSRRTLDAHAWETHVLRDLRPYVCTYKDCKQADQQYDSYQQWVAHETQFHESMQLHTKHLGNEILPHHTDVRSEIDLRKNHVNPSLFHAEPQNKAAPLQKHRHCPICTEENVAMSHVGLHLLKIALFALPRSTGLEDDLDQGDSEDSRLADMNELDSLMVDEEQEDLTAVFPNNEANQEPSTLSQDALKIINNNSKITFDTRVGDYIQDTQYTGKKIWHRPLSFKSVVGLIIKQNRANRLSRLTGVEAAIDQEDIADVDTLQHLGEFLSAQGNHKKAEEAFQTAFTKKSRLFGPEDLSTLESTYSLGVCYWRQNKETKAQTMLQLALTRCKHALGPEHELTLQTIRTLGELYFDQGRLKEAEAMDQQALSGYEKLLGEEHESTISTLRHLAAVYRSEERWDDAEMISRRALSGAEKSIGPTNSFTLDVVSELAMVLEKLEKDEAEELYRRLLSARVKNLGQNHLDTINSRRDVARLLQARHKNNEAEGLYRQVLQSSEEILGPEHEDTLRSVRDLACVLSYHTAKLGEAETLYRRALQEYEKKLGQEHVSTINVVQDLAVLLQDQGKYDEAETLFRRALQGYEKMFGQEHVSTIMVVRYLALSLQDQGKYNEAETLFRRALRGYGITSGQEHSATLDMIQHLASSLNGQNNYHEAETLYRRALQASEKKFAPEHSRTMQVSEALAGLLHNQGKYEEAETLYRRVLQVFEKDFGPENPITQRVSAALAATTKAVNPEVEKELQENPRYPKSKSEAVKRKGVKLSRRNSFDY